MMKMKRAMSALVITVLLVAISIGIGSMVVGWVSTYSTNTMSAAKSTGVKLTSCQDLTYSVYREDLYQYNGSYRNISIFVVNGDHVIYGFVVKVEDSNGSSYILPKELSEVNSYFSPDERKWINFVCPECSGDIVSAQLIPLFRANGADLQPCDANRRTYDASSFRYN